MALRNTLILMGSLVMLFVTSIKLTLWVLLLTPIAIIPVIGLQDAIDYCPKKAKAMLRNKRFCFTGFGRNGCDKVYQYERIAGNHFDQVVEEGFDVSKRRIKARSLLTLFIIILMVGAMVVVMWLGAVEVLSQDSGLSAGQLAQFFMYAVFVATSVGSLSEVWGDLMRASGALQRIIALLAEPEQNDKVCNVQVAQILFSKQ